jgi:hypothetical protein
MFRDASQPVRSNKPIPTVCVIRLLFIIPPTSPEFKLLQEAGPRGLGPRRQWCGPPRSFPRSSTTRLPCWVRAYLCTDAGSARARPLGVSAVESGVEATVGPSRGINLSVQKHFTLAATRAAESCFPGVGRRPFGWAVIWLTASDWVWDGTANPYRSYSSAEHFARKEPRRCRRG